MKLMCKCGNVEDIKTNVKIEKFEINKFGENAIELVCKNCKEVLIIKLKDS